MTKLQFYNSFVHRVLYDFNYFILAIVEGIIVKIIVYLRDCKSFHPLHLGFSLWSPCSTDQVKVNYVTKQKIHHVLPAILSSPYFF